MNKQEASAHSLREQWDGKRWLCEPAASLLNADPEIPATQTVRRIRTIDLHRKPFVEWWHSPIPALWPSELHTHRSGAPPFRGLGGGWAATMPQSTN
jgi:hypothetical protein